ncbi:MAG: hypothetical protein JSS09_03650, partial [Verrucomicrobia bacterium]|nr:hypothetical protein [Verrucomicrobiota bacterium]
MKSLCGLYQDLEATQKIEPFEEYSITLKTISRRFLEEGVSPPFDVKSPYESIYSNLCSTELQHALLKKGD